jgi:hypothetical protein
MKTVFDTATRNELISRINTLGETSEAAWGKMNVYQALKHCRLWDEWILSGKVNRQAFIGRLFGKMALKKIMKNDGPLTKNMPTLPQLKITETTGDISAEKKKWTALIGDYAHFSNPEFIHPFFGKMTREQVGQMAYKHADHHLRQFNA